MPCALLEATGGVTRVSAIVVTRFRPRELAIVLDRLAALAVDEVVLVENGDTGAAEAVGAEQRGVRVVRLAENRGIAARNVGAEVASGELLLMLDDDAYPLAGAVETLVAAFDAAPRLAAASGRVREVDLDGRVLRGGEPGGFDWFLRGGRREPADGSGIPAYFFAEGASMLRRSAFVEAGGFFEPFFFACEGIELATRLLGRGWDVRYFPRAGFDHLKADDGRLPADGMLYHRVRNHLWYLWLRFPATVAARRTPAYLAFDLVEAVYRGATAAWWRGVRDAWLLRDRVRGERRPLPRAAVRRAELDRGRLHLRLLGAQAGRRLAAAGRR